jgi:hypothetical protein
VQLISIGLLGEYIGRIYMETKQRPSYLIRKSYGGEQPRSTFYQSPSSILQPAEAPPE